MMKKLLISSFLFLLGAVAHADPISYIQLRSTLQPGKSTSTVSVFNVSSGTVKNLTVSTATVPVLFVTSGTVTTLRTSSGTVSFASATVTNLAVSTAAISSGTATSFTVVASSAQALSMLGNKITSVSSGTIASDVARFSQVKVLQVLSFTLSAASATTATSFINTSLTGTITPQSTSSKVFILADGTLSTANLSQGADATIMRNGTNLGNATGGLSGMLSAGVVTDGIHVPCHLSILDSPATTSAITYTVGLKTGGAGTATWNSTSIGANSTLTLIEVNGL